MEELSKMISIPCEKGSIGHMSSRNSEWSGTEQSGHSRVGDGPGRLGSFRQRLKGVIVSVAGHTI
jgi:hypothetical protein